MSTIIEEIVSDLLEILDLNSGNRNDFNSLTRRGKIKIQAIIEKILYLKNEEIPKEDFILSWIEKYNDQQKQVLLDKLYELNQNKFENLIIDLLESMEYYNINIKSSCDLSMDIIANMKIGITEFTEAIKVKRQKTTIRRSVLDQLRGSLPYFDANRGTIINLSSFNPECKKYASFQHAYPINLIDGNLLIDLLFKNRVGTKKKKLIFYSIDDVVLDKITKSSF